MKLPIICYELPNGKSYLAYYTKGTLADAIAEAEKINTEKPMKLWNGTNADCENRRYFAEEQEPMY